MRSNWPIYSDMIPVSTPMRGNLIQTHLIQEKLNELADILLQITREYTPYVMPSIGKYGQLCAPCRSSEDLCPRQTQTTQHTGRLLTRATFFTMLLQPFQHTRRPHHYLGSTNNVAHISTPSQTTPRYCLRRTEGTTRHVNEVRYDNLRRSDRYASVNRWQ